MLSARDGGRRGWRHATACLGPSTAHRRASSGAGSDARHARRFGHGTVKMVRQAQSREKLLQKKLEEGLTEKPQRDAEWDFSFPDPGLPVTYSASTDDPRRLVRLPRQ